MLRRGTPTRSTMRHAAFPVEAVSGRQAPCTEGRLSRETRLLLSLEFAKRAGSPFATHALLNAEISVRIVPNRTRTLRG